MPAVTVVPTPGLGDRSYLVDDGRHAVVIDPQRDIDRIVAVLTERDLTVTHVVETHIHNDYVSGGLELATLTGAAYGIAAADAVGFERLPIDDGDRFRCGLVDWQVIHTPGHTPHHLSFLAIPGGGDPAAVFTGGSLLYGTVGRTDLISPEATEGLTRSQYRSVRGLLTRLPAEAAVYPTHGFGSFCASAPGETRESGTIEGERNANVVMRYDDEDAFVVDLLAGLTPYPRYYAHMAPRNRSGPPPADLTVPPSPDHAELNRRIAAGEWVVDIRSRRAFAAGHLEGSINVEWDEALATYLGWAMPWGTPVTLIGDTAQHVDDAQRQLTRIGIDRPAGRLVGEHGIFEAEDRINSYRVAGFEELAVERRSRPEIHVLDVRDAHEWEEGHVPGALLIPFYELDERLAELPRGELWVHCRSGYRAATACSLLDRAGHTVVLVDDLVENAARKGVEMVSGP